MTRASGSSRRERNKQDKLDRITKAAAGLFATRGVSEVTTAQIADAADIGTGTLFLYVKTKSDLLLLVQNASYAAALRQGQAAAAGAGAGDEVSAVMAILRPVIVCNRSQVENGRSYLREMVFGDSQEPPRREAVRLAAATEDAITGVLVPGHGGDAKTLARVVSAVLFLTLATSEADRSIEQIAHLVQDQVNVVVGRAAPNDTTARG